MADWSSYSDDEIRSLAGKPVGQWDHLSDEEVRKIAGAPQPKKSDWSQEMVAGIPVIGPAFDKAVAGSNALIHGTGYQEELEKQQKKHERYTEEHPIGGRAAGIAGNLLMPVAPGGAAATALGMSGPLPLRMMAGGATGAGIGATDAAVRNGYDPNAILTGGAVGGTVGAAAPVIGNAIGAGYRGLSNWLGPKIPEPLSNLGTRAQEMLSRAFHGSTPESLAATRAEMGPNTFAGELTPGGLGLTRGIAGGEDAAANEVRASFNERFGGSKGRIESTLNENVGQRANVPQTLEQLLDERSRTAKPLYDAAFNKPVPSDPRLLQLYQDPRVRDAMMRNLTEQQTEALAKGEQFQPSGWRMIDAAKRGLDDAVERGKDPLTRRPTSEGRVASMLRGALVERMDQLNPEYAAARKAWEGPTKVRIAAEKAKEFLGGTMDHNEMAQQFARMSESEQAGAKLTMRNQLAMMMDRARNGDTQVRNLLLSDAAQKKIATAFNPQAAEAVRKSLQEEVNIAARTQQVVPNWATGASNVTREESRALANPASPLATWYKNIDFSRPHTVLGASLEPSHHIEAAAASANEQARRQLAPVLTSSSESDSLLRALVAAKVKQEGIGRGSARADMLTTRLAAGIGRRVAKEAKTGQ